MDPNEKGNQAMMRELVCYSVLMQRERERRSSIALSPVFEETSEEGLQRKDLSVDYVRVCVL